MRQIRLEAEEASNSFEKLESYLVNSIDARRNGQRGDWTMDGGAIAVVGQTQRAGRELHHQERAWHGPLPRLGQVEKFRQPNVQSYCLYAPNTHHAQPRKPSRLLQLLLTFYYLPAIFINPGRTH
jgi:hypothetical protein